MRTIGLTGGIGSGKSRVAEWLAAKRIPVLDADRIVHTLYDGDRELVETLAREFGPAILTENGKIDRKALGKMVFDRSAVRLRVEQIVHPRVFQAMLERQKLLAAAGHPLCIWDVPLLLEGGGGQWVDEVWVVWAPLDIRIRRIQLRDKLAEEDIRKRIEAQMPLEEKTAQADIVIDNSGPWAETVKQLEGLEQGRWGSGI